MKKKDKKVTRWTEKDRIVPSALRHSSKVKKYVEEVDEDSKKDIEELERDRKEYRFLFEKVSAAHHNADGYRFFERLAELQPGDRIYNLDNKFNQYISTKGNAWKALIPIVLRMRELLLRNEPKVREKRNAEKKMLRKQIKSIRELKKTKNLDDFVIYDSGSKICVISEEEYEEWILGIADYKKEKVYRSGFKGTVGELIEALDDPDSDEMHDMLNISNSVKIDLNTVKAEVVSWEKDPDIRDYIYIEIRIRELEMIR